MQTTWRQFTLILTHSLRAELAGKERMLSPLLFAATILLLFYFAMGEMPDELVLKTYVAETFLAAFFALQITFARMFEPESEDQAFDVLRTYPISPYAWFASKYLSVVILGMLVLTPTMLLSAFFHQKSQMTLLSWPLFFFSFLVILGLAALGVLLSAVTMRAQGQRVLYPLLYFPLTTPVMLAATQVSITHLDGSKDWNQLLNSWLGLLIAFDLIYITLGTLLYGEMVGID